ncbi:hypothetical protein BGM26_07680 [Bacillus sp. FJAT-29790]|uniref:hypothetical protein n=1 Tax=Bacillus sp. FJAT-29790 TaxID=1895002 RepID=UPI001C224943|nr:hypothetical protein [Bacillus sp. FJAT-29790]MBU8878865.1 hypothetical protein [Bacillus sp. FJAT-29790]
MVFPHRDYLAPFQSDNPNLFFKFIRKEFKMQTKIIILSLLSFLILSAFGQKTPIEPITLFNHEQTEVTFPLEKPAVFFFITTYK